MGLTQKAIDTYRSRSVHGGHLLKSLVVPATSGEVSVEMVIPSREHDWLQFRTLPNIAEYHRALPRIAGCVDVVDNKLICNKDPSLS